VTYSDGIKLHSGYGAKWSSAALSAWNFGTIAQRLNPDNWWTIYGRLYYGLAPYGFTALLAVGLSVIMFTVTKSKAPLVALAAGLLVPIVVFFNLYIPHPYYFIALTPIASIFVALGMIEVLKRSRRFSNCVKVPGVCVLVVSLLLPYYLQRRVLLVRPTADYVAVGSYIDQHTSSHGMVFLIPADYSGPAVLYYAKRRGLFVHHAEHVTPYLDHIRRYGYSNIVCTNDLNLADNGLLAYHLVTNMCGYHIYSNVP
jgi:hypothetical protein